MMRNWIGIVYLSADISGMRSLVTALNQPIRPIKKIAILDTFIEVKISFKLRTFYYV